MLMLVLTSVAEDCDINHDAAGSGFPETAASTMVMSKRV